MKDIREKRLRKKRIRRIAGIIGLCILFVGIYGAVYTIEAGYRTEQRGSFTLTVAGFEVSIEDFKLVSEDAVIDCNTEDAVTYVFTIHNQSDVAVSYRAKAQSSNSNVQVIFRNGEGTLSYDDKSTVEMSISFFDPDIALSDITDLSITVYAEQLKPEKEEM